MSRIYSQAYLTAEASTAPEAIAQAGQLGYQFVGLRLLPNAPGGPHQRLLGDKAVLRECQARLADSGVGVFDLEIIRIGPAFDPTDYLPLLEAGAALQARAVLVAGDDPDLNRLSDHYAQLCALMQPYGMTADLEFMPWTAVRHAREALQVVTAAGRPSNAGILVDALHVARSDTSLADIAALPRALLHYAQMCDAPSTNAQGSSDLSVDDMIHTARCERWLPGEGAIDLRALFQALPPDLPISVEVPHHVRARAVGDLAWSGQALAASRALLDL
ncbi:sugar phosphate isomerase/epimerase [Limnohabitans sp. JirII-31]|uniref:sugar phosphate isomerase/epimerase family protein n=1 Tax=Limnohabitans sp. JirII-31 TaxID=1977908 RepID=UPI000C1E333F|nr:TIM barrel protein [Limnohabitans sp. JirII-31]PIT79796.1 xylose isomerase [Limnohabitans sp. JirII-31]